MINSIENDIKEKKQEILNSQTSDFLDNDNISSQVALDLENKIITFQDRKKAIKIIARMTSVHEKTLNRIIQKENKPGPLTIIKIYRYLLNAKNNHELILSAPQNISDYIKNKCKHFDYTPQVIIDMEQEIVDSPVFLQIFLMIVSGGVKSKEISKRYGEYGSNILNKMLLTQVAVSSYKNSLITIGPNLPILSSKCIKHIGIQLLKTSQKNNYNSLDNHFQAFHVEGLNPDSFKKWLNIDEEAYLRKREIANNPKNHGKIRAFCYSIVNKFE